MITQEDIDAMEDGMGLVERLQWAASRDDDAAVMIETDRTEAKKLLDEVDGLKKASLSSTARYVNAIWGESERNKNASDDYMALLAELAAEKVLADRLYEACMGADYQDKLATWAAYRKARGL